MQDDGAGPKIARAIGVDRLFAHVPHPALENLRPALRALPQRLLTAEIDRRGLAVTAVFRLAEIKLRLEIVAQPDQAGEWFACFAAKTLQRPHHTLADQCFNFLIFKLPARNDFPQGEVAVFIGALKLLVRLLDDPPAFGTRHFQFAKVARDGVVFVPFGLSHDAAGHFGNFAHEGGALQLAPLHLLKLKFPVAGEFG